MWDKRDSDKSIKQTLEEINKKFNEESKDEYMEFHDVNHNYNEEVKVNESTARKLQDSQRKA